MFGLDAFHLARIQFAFTVSFHIIFPAITIGLASYLGRTRRPLVEKTQRSLPWISIISGRKSLPLTLGWALFPDW